MRLRTGAGWQEVRPVLAAHRKHLLRFAAWSVLATLPTLLSGRLVAAAVDHGFLAGSVPTGLLLLGSYGLAVVFGAFAVRQAMPHLAVVVEAVRDTLTSTVVSGTLRGAVAGELTADASTLAKIGRQTEQARQQLAALLMAARTVGLALFAAFLGLFSLAPLVALIALPLLCLASVPVIWLSRIWQRRYDAALAAEERLSARLGRLLDGLRDVHACAATGLANAETERELDEQTLAARSAAAVGAVRLAVLITAARIPLLVLLLASPALVAGGQLSTGAVLGAATYLITGLEPALRALVETVGNTGLQLLTLLNRLAVLRVPATVESRGRTADRLEISADSVSFSYGGQPVLDRLSLRIAEGQHLAIVGPSGIGKSTLAALLGGSEDRFTGGLVIGGVPIEHLDRDWLHRTVALVPQEAYLFRGSVRENLCYLDRTATDGELDGAVAALGAGELIDRLGGYSAPLLAGELSEGERQLLTLLRVYLSPARIVLLDEATGQLDQPTEATVESAFAARPGTLIVIAHRISSARRADRVLLIGGSGCATGSHDELVRHSPEYAALVGRWCADSRPVAAPTG